MTSNIEESSTNEIEKGKFKHQIDLVKENKISWEDLELIFDVLTPTVMSMKQLIKTLIEELKIALSDQNQESSKSKHNEMEVIEINTEFEREDQDMDEVEGTIEKKSETVQIPTENEFSIQESVVDNLENASDGNEGANVIPNEIPDIKTEVEDSTENENLNEEIEEEITLPTFDPTEEIH